MEKKLPSIFANRIDKNIKNNENLYYSKLNEEIVKEQKKEIVKNEERNQKNNIKLNINQKINNIFNSNKYVYKADVKIYLKDEEIDCRIIGRNATHLITMDNNLIPISDIVDIELLNK